MRLLQARNEIADFGVASEIASSLGITLSTAKLLVLRGAGTKEAAKEFLCPSTDSLYGPFELKDMDKAANTLKTHIDKGSSICILGDYDADGVTSTAILYLTLKHLGITPNYYIPSRQSEGYGLTMSALENIMKLEPDLLITVDCGVTSIEEVKELYNRGVSVIITDHHKCPGVLPNCEAVVNPNRQDCTYPFKGLAGVGVAAKLCEALTSKEYMLNFADLIALGTVADLMPLLSENRVYVKQGLALMNSDCNNGIKKLIDVSGFKGNELTARDIAFLLAPRVNAGGRMGDNSKSVEMLITEDENIVSSIAIELNELNAKRQQIVNDIQKSALLKLNAKKDLYNDYAIIVADSTYNHAVIGIVASKLVERYYRPAIVFGEQDGMLIGSARSIPGVDIHKVLDSCSELYERFGGHSQAAGLTIKAEYFGEFIRRINEYLKNNSASMDYVPKAVYDLELNIDDINEKFIGELDMLRPYGMANPRPDFYLNASIKDCKTIGADNSHLRFSVQEKNRIVNGVAFSYGHICDKITGGQKVDIICKAEINEWHGTKKVQLNASYIDNKIDHPTKLKSSWIFYDAMLDNVIYNYNINTQITDYSIITKDEIKAIFKEKVWGSIILCGSLEAYKYVKSNVFKDSVYYDEYIGYIDNNETLYNAAVYAPLFEKMDGIWLENAIYIDCTPILNIAENTYVLNINDKKKLYADREDLLKCYYAVKALDKLRTYSTYDQLYEEIFKIDNEISAELLYSSIKIFKELDLIKIREGSDIKISMTKGKKVDLQNSILYKALNDLSR